ncbi:conjugative transposon protein TraN [Pontibacter litorisediminis]|uniref:conjugative transposon protein TraN n=1 Tax=Pontibacter litorisediminis TaxID=1846260 RepID=UPI0023ED1AAF|nr:conjugative transposon protein TraN [Pontibacter litorisediminis]
MKNKSFYLILCLLLLRLQAYAQTDVEPLLELSTHQTTSLVFPYPILSVDRGSGDVLAQVPEQTANVLQVKGARENFPGTNLTVITTDGKLYSFPVRYAPAPSKTLLTLDRLSAVETSVLLPGDRLNEARLSSICRQLAEDTPFYHGIKAKAGGIKVALEGIYTKGNTIFYRLVLHNASTLAYALETVRFATRDRQQARRTARQEVDWPPYYAWEAEDAVVAPGEAKVLLYALERFPLGPGQEQVIELYERHGARHLTLRVRGRHLQQASSLLFH